VTVAAATSWIPEGVRGVEDILASMAARNIELLPSSLSISIGRASVVKEEADGIMVNLKATTYLGMNKMMSYP
jgi:hypothetical protein